jgi:hypothetical protein
MASCHACFKGSEGCELLLLLLCCMGAIAVQVVVPQGVLTRASAELTINQASAIADNTLEVSCRAILWALNVPEVLRASAGKHLRTQHTRPDCQWLPCIYLDNRTYISFLVCTHYPTCAS